jgi:hypothetical protein
MARTVRRRSIPARGRVADRGMVVEEEIVEPEVFVDDAVVDRTVARAPWSPAQMVAIVIGTIFLLLGAVALARTGIDFENVSAQHVDVAGFHHTALLGLVELVVGLFLIGAGAMPGAGRASMTFFGVLLLGFGVVVLAQPSAFHRTLGTHGGHGALYVLTGVILMAAAMVSPVFFDRDRRYARRSGVVERETYIR